MPLYELDISFNLYMGTMYLKQQKVNVLTRHVKDLRERLLVFHNLYPIHIRKLVSQHDSVTCIPYSVMMLQIHIMLRTSETNLMCVWISLPQYMDLRAGTF